MFENLSNRISRSIRSIIYNDRLTEKNIRKMLDEVRVSLLEADVALPVIHNFIYQVTERTIGRNVSKHLTPNQEFIKIVHTVLTEIIGETSNHLDLKTQTPSVMLIVGSQGSGKTTTVSKLARFLRTKKNKKVLVTSVDMYRPAGHKQLEDLICTEKHVSFFSSYCLDIHPIEMINQAITFAKSKNYDVLLIDTAGCLDTDHDSLEKLSEIYKSIHPIETLLVVDIMIGQVSMNTVSTFNKTLPLTGVILSKSDGDTRGGVALSIKYLTGKFIKFVGTGEKINDLEVFHARRVASRILGMGDILSLVEDLESRIHKEEEKKSFFQDEKNFNLFNFLEYVKRIRGMGGISKIFSKLPNLGISSNDLNLYIDDKIFNKMEVIINSMTKKERLFPEIITKSRKKRIAAGSGVSMEDVSVLLKRFHHIRATIQSISKNGILKMMTTLKNKNFFNFFKS